MNKYCFLIIFSIFLFGCVYTNNSFDEISVTAILADKYQLKLESGEVTPSDTIANMIYYSIKFDRVRGGENMLFGQIKIKESNGYKAKRLAVYNKNNELVTRLSINEITNSLQDFENINLAEFIKID